MLETIVGLAFQIQFSVGKEGKNIAILYGPENTAFDPLTMKDIEQPEPTDGEDNNDSIETDNLDDPLVINAAMPTRVVAYCTGFGVQGSAGVAQKCSVVLA